MNIKQLLDEHTLKYNNTAFIATDPIQIPHNYTLKEDIEIAAFLTATIAWGNRASIIKNAYKLMQLMDNVPYQFVTQAAPSDLKVLTYFVHRTFNGSDCTYFIQALQNIYNNHQGLEVVFTKGYNTELSIFSALQYFRQVFFELPHATRVNKHVSNVTVNAAAKRLNMFLRWLVRSDNTGVDFGLWNNIPSSALHLPLDIHTGNVARELGLLKRKQNDWNAVVEITDILRTFDPIDPIKYDFALFGMGAFK